MLAAMRECGQNGGMLEFYWSWLWFVVSQTWNFYLHQWGIATLIFVAGLIFHWKKHGSKAAVAEWRVFVSWGIKAVLLLVGVAFVVNFFRAPYEFYEEAKQEARTVRSEPGWFWTAKPTERGIVEVIIQSNSEIAPFGLEFIADGPVRGSNLHITDSYEDLRIRVDNPTANGYLLRADHGIKPGQPWRVYLYGPEPFNVTAVKRSDR